MGQYHEPRGVLVDVASNLVKEGLEPWLPAFLAAAERPRVARDRPRARCGATSPATKRLWLLMQRLRRTDRAWQRRVRRRPYPFLLAAALPLRTTGATRRGDR